MPYASLRDFIARLEASGRLTRVRAPVSPFLEMTEIQTRLLAEAGPAVLFENVVREGGGALPMPVLVNLFSMSSASRQPPGGWREALDMLNRLTSTGIGSAPPPSRTTFSNSTAGPASARRRVWISVISRNGDTGALTRVSRPLASSRAMKSRRLA